MSNEYSGNLELYWDLHIQLLIYVTICFFHLLIVWKLHIATATTIVMWRIFQFTTTFSFFNQLKKCKLYYNRNSLVILKKWKKFLIFHTEYLSEHFCCGIAKTSFNRYSISYPEPDSTHGIHRHSWFTEINSDLLSSAPQTELSRELMPNSDSIEKLESKQRLHQAMEWLDAKPNEQLYLPPLFSVLNLHQSE